LPVLARSTRTGVVETETHGHIAVADADGNLMGWAGSPEARYYLRSSAKPLQALSVVASGAYEALGLTPKELAVCCASHSGSFEHQEAVLSILRKAGLSEDDLRCGTHAPGDAEARNALIREGRAPTPVHNNCSGKHAGKLATAVHIGAPVGGYLDRNHPVQRTIVGNIRALSGVPADEIHIGVDGCGSPVHCLPLRAMALAFARAASHRAIPDDLAAAAFAIRKATGRYPHMVASHGDLNTDVLAAFAGEAIAKSGAEGLLCIGFAEPAVCVAVKVLDGSFRAMGPIIVRVLEQLDLSRARLKQLAKWRRRPVTNCRGEEVGWVEATEFVI
jgi:L-asparaginase II